jgi:GAF domain-containing protein
MQETTREGRILETFAVLADSLVADYDIVDLLQTLVERCQELLSISQAGILLADGEGELHVVASTDERSGLIELMQLGPDGGPCVECYRSGSAVAVPDLALVAGTWTQFHAEATEQGFHAVHAFPLRLRRATIGSLNLFGDETGSMTEIDTVAAQAMADVATIGIMQQRALAESDVVRNQLQHALDSRVVIEQAKGVVSYSHRIPVDEAFTRIRSYARSNGMQLTMVAQQIVRRELVL